MTAWPSVMTTDDASPVSAILCAADPVTVFSVDLIGDGRPAVTMTGRDLRGASTLTFIPTRRGTYQLEVRIVDVNGRTATTGAVRRVTVR